MIVLLRLGQGELLDAVIRIDADRQSVDADAAAISRQGDGSVDVSKRASGEHRVDKGLGLPARQAVGVFNEQEGIPLHSTDVDQGEADLHFLRLGVDEQGLEAGRLEIDDVVWRIYIIDADGGIAMQVELIIQRAGAGANGGIKTSPHLSHDFADGSAVHLSTRQRIEALPHIS